MMENYYNRISYTEYLNIFNKDNTSSINWAYIDPTSLKYTVKPYVHNFVKFNQYEINIIKNLFPNNYVDSELFLLRVFVGYKINYGAYHNLIKLNDEWYLLKWYTYMLNGEDAYIYYKCDQLDGLIKCLTHLKYNYE